MKANELQIGDYVNYRGQIKKVTSLYDKGGSNEVGWSKKESVWVNADNVEPIPLTPENLEKNGFGVLDQGDGRKDVWTGFGVDCEGDIEVEFRDNIPIHLKIDGGFKGEYYTSANIKYVHQLQHAFRLCGIEKTIEL